MSTRLSTPPDFNRRLRDGSSSSSSSLNPSSPTNASRNRHSSISLEPLLSSASPASLPAQGYFDSLPTEDRRPVSKKGTLPLYGQRRGGPSTWGAFARVKLRSGKLRWVVLGMGVMLVGWGYLSSGGLDTTAAPSAALRQQAARPTPPAARHPPIPPPDQPNPPPSLQVPLTVHAVDVNVFPSSSSAVVPPSPSERFLAYTPHSGYHNQRISLENALTLAFILGRTLLLPPVWLGHAIPYVTFDKLQRRLQMASKAGLDRCKELGEGGSEDPIPRECEGYFDWTHVHWDFLVDLKEVGELVPLRNRWNQTQVWLEEELGLERKMKGAGGPDTFYLKDDTMYQYRFYDSLEDEEPLAKFENRLDVNQLAADSESFKLLHLGSLFGTSRLRTTTEDNFNARSTFRKAMVFKNPLLDEITEAIRDRLGGAGAYYGLHLRVGDGIFQKNAGENMAGVWSQLCEGKMKLSEDLCREVAESSLTNSYNALERRRDDSTIPLPPPSVPSPATLVKRANSRPQREGAFHHAPLPPPRIVTSPSNSPLDPSLSCRRPLHTTPHLLPFNTPLFLATDSRVPTADTHLAIFFDAFPCTFILSDFASPSAINPNVVEGLNKLTRLRNAEDRVPLAQFLYPQLDAQIAAYGRDLLGTPQSTYSRFAADVLHQVYQCVSVSSLLFEEEADAGSFLFAAGGRS